jgi:exosortase A-associated hydrolase 1
MIPAGAQNRVGPHRQHVLIARALASRGVATLRYDSSGTGDSAGPYRDFELGPDIDGASDALLANAPGVTQVVLWGICGSASAILMHQQRRAAVRGFILVNPWVRSEQSRARTYLKHYYLSRLGEGEFWRKLFSGGFGFRSALVSFLGSVRSAMVQAPAGTATERPTEDPAQIESRMAEGLEAFSGGVLLILSGRDLTAREFDEFTRSSKRWRRLLKSGAIRRRDLPEADHVFSEPQWRDQMIDWMTAWLIELERESDPMARRVDPVSQAIDQPRPGRLTAM